MTGMGEEEGLRTIYRRRSWRETRETTDSFAGRCTSRSMYNDGQIPQHTRRNNDSDATVGAAVSVKTATTKRSAFTTSSKVTLRTAKTLTRMM